jgi:hypothetical protein
VYIDLTNGMLGHLDAKEETNGIVGDVSFTANSISASLLPIVTQDISGMRYRGMDADNFHPAIYTYGKDQAAVEACYSDGAWDMEALSELESLSGFFDDKYAADNKVSAGQIIIPRQEGNSWRMVVGYNAGGDLPDKSLYNQDGYYGILTYADPDDIYYGTTGTDYCMHYDLYKVGVEPPLYSHSFRAGDIVTVSGTPSGLMDVIGAKILSIDDETNTITFETDVFTVFSAYRVVTDAVETGEVVHIRFRGSDGHWAYGNFRPDQKILKNDICALASSATKEEIFVFRNGAVIATYDFTSESSGHSTIMFYEYEPSEAVIAVSRSVPDLDFICEKDNRLWGVSNSQKNDLKDPDTGKVSVFNGRAIYASALGDPTNWWVFDGVDTDAYQVSVGSAGNFTGICSFGGAVCCWKEHILHKIFGSYPSEYYMTDSHIEGVGAGSERSMAVINDTLYYNGATGVYAFNGGSPVLIGYEIGQKLKNAVGGTDGTKWYLSATREDGETELLCYDLKHRKWIREDDTDAKAFAFVSDTLYIVQKSPDLQENDVIYKVDQDASDEQPVSWRADFVAFDEASTNHKYYLRIILKVDLSPNSSVSLFASEDGEDWQEVLTNMSNPLSAPSKQYLSKNVEIPVKRCDSLKLRVCGYGKVMLRGITREYIEGSERA